MTSHPTWYQDDLNPSIGSEVTSGGTGVDLTTNTVKFGMRAVGGTAVKVYAPATSADAAGNWSYEWAAGDLDTPGEYLAWLDVFSGPRKQTLWESTLEVLPHGELRSYIEVAQIKDSLNLEGTSYTDATLGRSVRSASRAIENITGRRFWLDATPTARYYTPESASIAIVDDFVAVTGLLIDRTGSGQYGESWVSPTDYQPQPVNALVNYRPYEWLRVRPLAGRWFPSLWPGSTWYGVPQGLKLTAQYGWPEVPADIVTATELLAIKLLRRAREAPFGIVTMGIDQGTALRIGRTDPDLPTLIGDYSKRRPWL